MKKIDNDTTLIILSDHGFGPFRRYFHINRWLKDNGYLNFIDDSLSESNEFFENVDFGMTKAYSLGFNGIYLNLFGREGMGIVYDGARKRKDLIKNLIRQT